MRKGAVTAVCLSQDREPQDREPQDRERESRVRPIPWAGLFLVMSILAVFALPQSDVLRILATPQGPGPQSNPSPIMSLGEVWFASVIAAFQGLFGERGPLLISALCVVAGMSAVHQLSRHVGASPIAAVISAMLVCVSLLMIANVQAINAHGLSFIFVLAGLLFALRAGDPATGDPRSRIWRAGISGVFLAVAALLNGHAVIAGVAVLLWQRFCVGHASRLESLGAMLGFFAVVALSAVVASATGLGVTGADDPQIPSWPVFVADYPKLAALVLSLMIIGSTFFIDMTARLRLHWRTWPAMGRTVIAAGLAAAVFIYLVMVAGFDDLQGALTVSALSPVAPFGPVRSAIAGFGVITTFLGVAGLVRASGLANRCGAGLFAVTILLFLITPYGRGTIYGVALCSVPAAMALWPARKKDLSATGKVGEACPT